MMDNFGNEIMPHPSWVQRVEDRLQEQALELGRVANCLTSLTEMQRETLDVMKKQVRLDERLNGHSHRIESNETEIKQLYTELTDVRIATQGYVKEQVEATPKGFGHVLRDWAPTTVSLLLFLGVGMKLTVGG